MDQLDLSNVRRIAIDETSSRRGHQYITLFVTPIAIDVICGRRQGHRNLAGITYPVKVWMRIKLLVTRFLLAVSQTLFQTHRSPLTGFM